nr:MAG TPA: hypothetical protein [Caudoviricetes sp.]
MLTTHNQGAITRVVPYYLLSLTHQPNDVTHNTHYQVDNVRTTR